jgi:hypothetical protein
MKSPYFIRRDKTRYGPRPGLPTTENDILRILRTLSCLLILACTPALAQSVKAELKCKLTRTDYVYECTILLERSGRPLSGAVVTVGADMPSMPMAHSLKPVKAKPGRAPGEYEATLDLEMLGEWAVKLRLAGPVKDQLILHYDFDEKGAQPVIRSGKPRRK